jgi:hypothetical protein
MIGQLGDEDGFQRLEQGRARIDDHHVDPVRRRSMQVRCRRDGRGIPAELLDDGL